LARCGKESWGRMMVAVGIEQFRKGWAERNCLLRPNFLSAG
jgi:hypothetical protein